MNTRLLFYSLIMMFGDFISAVAQVLLKKSAQRDHGSIIKEYLNVRVIIAYTIFFSATLLSIFAYKVVPLSMGPILESMGYIYVTIFSVTIFKEKISKMKIIALALIITGILTFSLL